MLVQARPRNRRRVAQLGGITQTELEMAAVVRRDHDPNVNLRPGGINGQRRHRGGWIGIVVAAGGGQRSRFATHGVTHGRSEGLSGRGVLTARRQALNGGRTASRQTLMAVVLTSQIRNVIARLRRGEEAVTVNSGKEAAPHQEHGTQANESSESHR